MAQSHLIKKRSVNTTRLVNRNITAATGRTSMRLEPELWDALDQIARETGQTLAELIRRAESASRSGGRTSAVRVFVVGYFRSRAGTPEAAPDPGAGAARPGQRRRTTGLSGENA